MDYNVKKAWIFLPQKVMKRIIQILQGGTTSPDMGKPKVNGQLGNLYKLKPYL